MRPFLLAALSLTALTLTAADPARQHLHLVRSEPAANDTLHAAPAAIRLWFSSPPEMAITSVHLTTGAGQPVAVGPATRDAADTAPVVAPVKAPVTPGDYVVVWRTSAADGHMSQGRIPFVVGR
jgi:methionine-rich copper-binding protein CopC